LSNSLYAFSGPDHLNSLRKRANSFAFDLVELPKGSLKSHIQRQVSEKETRSTMKSAHQLLTQRIKERYDSTMYSKDRDEYYGYSGFHNFGYWNGDIRDQRHASENLIDHLVAMLPHRNGTILDVACGIGGSTRRLLRQYQPRAVTGINISDKQLATCRERTPGCRFLNMDATNLRFADRSFDNILCVEAAFHFDTREQFLREAYRVLKPGGSLALSDILLRSKLINTLLSGGLPSANYVPSLRDYEGLYVRCGFEDVHVIEARKPCWEGFRDSSLGYCLGKVLTGQASWLTLRRVATGLRRWDWSISHYLLVSARKPGDRR
jgi:MPBQ/MSBQ methyltransferase